MSLQPHAMPTSEAGGPPRRLGLRRSIAAGTVLCTIGLLVGNILLLRTNNDLDARLAAARNAQVRSMVPKVGTVLPELMGLSFDGDPISVTYSDYRQTILLIFSTTCPLCDANWPYWEALADQIDRERFRLVYGNLSDSLPAEYALAHGFDPAASTTIAKIDPQSSIDYSLRLTPMLLLIDPDGTVRAVWPGVTRDKTRRDIESALGIDLDGIQLATANR